MKPSIITLWLASAVGVTLASYGQQPAPQGPPSQTESPEPVKVSDSELETFASIYVDLLQTVSKFKGEMQSAKSEEQATEIQTRMQKESVEKVSQRGWSPEKFNSVTDAINKDPSLADKAAKLIEDRS
jgi:hypothetical protein